MDITQSGFFITKENYMKKTHNENLHVTERENNLGLG